ncbi:nicotinate phosphoribosyltransferase [Steccherinum ochraceum]|uniref:Nicotinate phosphoribosyltransferase n=1 Tax=Steccherinum ochraceum TaxID=92696 RepID=A0A4R0RNF0_9APHY|nr:nicotinate phosphoribosyltransferase [Steccherinum ochraceum]
MVHDTKRVSPQSMLDTDLYKFTMQQAVQRHFPDVDAVYRFTHRDKDVYFTRECYELFLEALSHFGELALTDAEREWLGRACPYFTPSYLDYLQSYRFNPSQVSVAFHPKAPSSSPDPPPGSPYERGRIAIEARGPWLETILWEVPLMATLSELFFTTADRDWTYDGQEAEAREKGRRLLEAGCTFSEFGTRRRRSYAVQDLVVGALVRVEREGRERGEGWKGHVSGTSNVHLAMKHGIAPVGTIAHEWFMAVGAMRGYEHANGIALDLWEDVYPDVLLLALTDTFSTEAFFKDFVLDKERANRWKGLRQDSGDPYVYAPRAKEVYESMGIDYRQKSIIYSDSVNLDKALKLAKQCREIGFIPLFGIGTWLSNDFPSVSRKGEKSKALNMVIKLAGVDGKHCVKISDELMKNTGDEETVKHVKKVFEIPEQKSVGS